MRFRKKPVVIDAMAPFALDEVAAEVVDCPECSRLVELIRERRHARRQLGNVKRRIRTVGKRALTQAGEP